MRLATFLRETGRGFVANSWVRVPSCQRCRLVPRLVSRSASLGGLRHLRGRRPVDPDLLSVYLHQVLLPKMQEEAAAEEEEGRQDRPDRTERTTLLRCGE